MHLAQESASSAHSCLRSAERSLSVPAIVPVIQSSGPYWHFRGVDGWKILNCSLWFAGFTSFGFNIKPLNSLYVLVDGFAAVKVNGVGGVSSYVDEVLIQNQLS